MAVKAFQARPRLITVDEYDQMIQAGVFPEDDRIELIEGQISDMSPIGASHAGLVKRLNRLFAARAGRQYLVSIQDPIRLARSEPQHDIALLTPRADDYAGSHPTARDVLLIIEVADTSAEYDRNVKIPLYGRGGVPEVWLIDLEGQKIEAHRGPNKAGYNEKHTYAAGDHIAAQALPGISLSVAEILGAEA